MSLNFVLPTLSWIFVFHDTSAALNVCLGKGYLNFLSTKSQLCSNENLFGEIFCWIWLSLLGILMSNVVDLFCIFFIFKDINKATEESRHMLSNQAYLNRKRYDKIICYNIHSSKAKLLLEAMFFIIIFTYLKYKYRYKWPNSTWQHSSIHFWHRTSLLRFLGHFGPVYLLQISKNDDEKHCF